jgi:hypothetical protein
MDALPRGHGDEERALVAVVLPKLRPEELQIIREPVFVV